MLPDIQSTVAGITPELVSLRRELHQHPEIRFEERWTSDRISQFLTETGIPHTRGHAKGTGIVGTIAGGGGKTVALRADMDALEIEEETGLPYASLIPERMHACGHDGHTAMLCGAAKALWLHREQLAGDVRLIFQPAEEQAAGGRLIVNEGLLDGVDAVFALHSWPDIPVGQVGVVDGCAMASADYFCVEIHGRGGHGADPAAAIDPIIPAAQMVLALQTIVSRETDPWESAVVSIARIEAGNASNVIPGSAQIDGTYRALKPEVRARTARAIERIARGIGEAFRVRVEVFVGEDGYPTLHNHPAMAAFARETAAALHGEKVIFPVAHPYMTAEDFAFYLQRVPGAFIFLGTRPQGAVESPSLHSPRFDFNDDALPVGAGLLAGIAARFVNGLD